MKSPEAMQAEWSEAIKAAGAMTEQQMREATVPTPASIDDLAKYITGLVDRPHDYGTCCYAMSMAAVAAFQFVASKLGVTGFQASCADLDVLARTRGWKWGKLLDYGDLLYPQYCDEKRFPSWRTILEENRDRFAELAAEKLAESRDVAAPAVVEHWTMLANLTQSKPEVVEPSPLKGQ